MATQLALAGLSYLPGGGLLISTVNTASSTTTSVLKSAWTGRPSTGTSTSTTRRTSGSTFFARSPSVGYEDTSVESVVAPSTPPPPATSPPLRPLMLSTLRQHRTTHTHRHQQRSSVSMGGPDVMMLGTTCSGCGSHVQVQVPPWMLSAIEGSQQRYSDTWRDDQDHYHHLSSSGPVPGARAPRIEGQQQPYRRARQADWRSTIVHTAIGTAHAIKASPIPGLILTFFRAMFAFALLLDARFSLHQRAAIILSRFLEGLVEIEKEVGVMRGAGEALSIGWEATVKGIIAFAKADSYANTCSTHEQPRKTSQPTTSIFTRQPPSSQHPSREQAQSSYFPPYHETHTYTAAKPAEPAPSFFGTSGDYPRHVFSSAGQGGSVLLADSEEDEQLSTSSPRLGVDLDYSHETSCPPSPPPPSTSTAHGRAEMAHPRPLRRTPMSSPALQSAYLAQSGGNRNPAGLPTSASATFGASSLLTSSMMPAYPFLASSPTETLLPPYDVASTAATGRAGTKPHPLHHSAVVAGSSSSYGTTDGGSGALHLRHHRSRSGPGNTQGGDGGGGGGGGLYLEPGGELLSSGGGAVPGPPPPSPVGSRAGWAGKAMLGLAERMKVI